MNQTHLLASCKKNSNMKKEEWDAFDIDRRGGKKEGVQLLERVLFFGRDK